MGYSGATFPGYESPVPEGMLDRTTETVRAIENLGKTLKDELDGIGTSISRILISTIEIKSQIPNRVDTEAYRALTSDVITYQSETFDLFQEFFESFKNSAIARSSPSPLEEALAKIEKGTVKFNEKTLRWQDTTTNLFAANQSSLSEAAEQARAKRVEATTLKDAGSDEMQTKKKVGLGVLAGFLEEISKDTKLILEKTSQTINMSAEDEMESAAREEERKREMKKRGKTLAGMWDTLKEKAKKSWFAENWKLILAGLILLFAPFKWIKKLYKAVKWFINAPLWQEILVALGLIASYLLLKKGAKKVMEIAKKGFKTFLQKRGVGMGGHLSDAQKKATQARMASKGQLLSQRLGTAAGKTKGAVSSGLKSAGGAVSSGLKSAGGAVKAVGGKLGDMASSTKGIFGSLVKKFGSAGKWIMKLGSKLIMPLVTTPIGWAILAGLAIGGLAYVFWDDLKKIWGNITGFVSETFSKVSEFASSMVGGARTMLGSFLRSVGAGMIADWIDPDGADKSKPAKKFTWKNFGLELWNIYTGIWKKVLSLAGAGMKAVRGIAASWARSMGWNKIGDWIEGKEEKEQPTGTDSESQDGKPDEPPADESPADEPSKKITSRQKFLLKAIKAQEKEIAGGDLRTGRESGGIFGGSERKEVIAKMKARLTKSGYTGPEVTKPPKAIKQPARDSFDVTIPKVGVPKTRNIAKGFKPTTTAEAKAQADDPDDPEDVEDTRIIMDLEKRGSGTFSDLTAAVGEKNAQKWISQMGPASEPAERQATFNAIQKENQIAQKTGQSDVVQINAGSSTSISPSESTYLVDKPTRNRKSIPTSLAS